MAVKDIVGDFPSAVLGVGNSDSEPVVRFQAANWRALVFAKCTKTFQNKT